MLVSSIFHVEILIEISLYPETSVGLYSWSIKGGLA